MGRRVRTRIESALTRVLHAVFNSVRFAEFEIFFSLFFVIAFVLFKEIISLEQSMSQERYPDFGPTSRPEYNQILVKKPGGVEF